MGDGKKKETKRNRKEGKAWKGRKRKDKTNQGIMHKMRKEGDN